MTNAIMGNQPGGWAEVEVAARPRLTPSRTSRTQYRPECPRRGCSQPYSNRSGGVPPTGPTTVAERAWACLSPARSPTHTKRDNPGPAAQRRRADRGDRTTSQVLSVNGHRVSGDGVHNAVVAATGSCAAGAGAVPAQHLRGGPPIPSHQVALGPTPVQPGVTGNDEGTCANPPTPRTGCPGAPIIW